MAARSRRRRSVPRALIVTGVLLAIGVAAVVGVVALLRALEDAPPLVARCVADVEGERHPLDPDQAANAALFAAIGTHRGLPARATTIAVATAIQESRLRNIDYGDRDSLGLFQQRPSQGWGTPEQVMDPVYATNAFFDVLVTVEGWEGLPVTDAAQRVQRSAFPEAYAQHEQVGRSFASALTGYSPAALTCVLGDHDGTPDAVAGAVSDRLVRDFVAVEANAEGSGADAVVVVDAASLGAEPARHAWGVAHWAVATAAETGAGRVAVDGREWDRSRGADAGWEPLADGEAGPPDGEVWIAP
ncbi:conserved hypothetical protein [Beutenbergia cavernae DSM 12333]|uniref:Uncharacterized protein n=1 Tax=Beutenbergia cavernae (strain ATCC BAA-8 / DSM 12333 / CCUG 43141 / JCM 11478 / NBRC 16432 / NCIMB 13614 / HKI 0122) TaxID=471853 RepID=C5C0Y7_BEUC1|nr:hypothetical protein [Beutenbergia cavernae]ACQ79391.1 conserved hypothetical protein [Beutenbergia cavernae DSM 12333]